ncbi:hypothetical protein [Acidiphilium sp.]|jgi:hypothetical protein|uniref:hypothetical protein n=1 Tax=Acidiphilium sp. TaxID=527 RepID=UPI00055114BA|nr:hypothetical protein [Acidiphilium sp.]
MNAVTPDAAAASTWQDVDPDAAAGRPMIPFKSDDAAPECRAARRLRNEIRQRADCGKFHPGRL